MAVRATRGAALGLVGRKSTPSRGSLATAPAGRGPESRLKAPPGELPGWRLGRPPPAPPAADLLLLFLLISSPPTPPPIPPPPPPRDNHTPSTPFSNRKRQRAHLFPWTHTQRETNQTGSAHHRPYPHPGRPPRGQPSEAPSSNRGGRRAVVEAVVEVQAVVVVVEVAADLPAVTVWTI